MALFAIAQFAHAHQANDTLVVGDSLPSAPADNYHKIHLISADFCPGGILHTNDFLVGDNPEERTMNHATTYKLKYAFMEDPNSPIAQIYKGAYQGIGLAYHEFNPQLSNPVSVYLFQGARIFGGKRVSLNYEWNLGLTFGWNPYDSNTNPSNHVIGSKVTAYINADFYANIILTRWLDLNIGASVSHFSNGNTAYPNMGLNTLAAKVGLAYYFNRPSLQTQPTPHVIPPFQRHISYDLVLFGAWRTRGYTDIDTYQTYVLPGTYAVWGFNFNPMYRFNHWLKAGISLDGTYDRSSNIVIGDNPTDETIVPLYSRPRSAWRQMALGASARVEFCMPYFAINFGMCSNFLNATDDFHGIYELLALKLNITRRLLLHVGYTLNDFHRPRHLMLGVGWRFGCLGRS